jgi:hypothetical protein
MKSVIAITRIYGKYVLDLTRIKAKVTYLNESTTRNPK